MPIKSFFDYLTHKDKYKIIYILTIVSALYGYYVLGIGEDDALRSILIAFQFEIFNLFFFIITFLTTMFVIETFNNDFSNIIIRLKNKKNYLLNIVLINIIMFLFNLFLFGIIYFTLIIISKIGTTQITTYEPYNINTLMYVIYYMGRYFILLLNINIISIYLYLNFGRLKTGIFQIIILLFIVANSLNSFRYYIYSDFSNDFMISMSKIILSIIIIGVLNIYSIKKGKLDIT